MAHVFISYARKDARWAERLDNDIQAAGFDTWRDTRDLDSNQDFTGEIEEGIRAASQIVVCLTPDVQRRDSFVRREIQYALNQDRWREQREAGRLPLIPVVFPGGELPVHISTWTALFLENENDYTSLFSDLLERIRNPITPADRPTYKDHSDTVLYLQELHEWCSQRLAETVKHLLTLETSDTPGQVDPRRASMFRIGFVVSSAVKAQSATSSGSGSAGKIFGSLEDAFHAHHRRILLLGAPGSGKTTALLSFARDAAVTRLSNPSEPLPVLASIHTWDHQSPLVKWLQRASPWPQHGDEKLLYLLDGLDELGGEIPVNPEDPESELYDPRARFMDAIVKDIPSGPIVVTSRGQEYREIRHRAPLNAALTLQPLSDVQIQDYLEACNQAFLWGRLQHDPEFAVLARTPLLLGMLSMAIGQETELAGQVGTSFYEGAIFDRYIRRRFLHEASKPGVLPFDEQRTRVFLATLAANMWLDSEPGTREQPCGWMTPTRWSYPAQRASLDYVELSCLLGAQAEQFLNFCIEMHFLRKERDGMIAFQHLKLRDFCVMSALFELMQLTHEGEENYESNPLGIDFTQYPLETATHFIQIISFTARQALRLIGRGGVDLIQAARWHNATLVAGEVSDKRVRHSSSPELSIPVNDPSWTRDTICIPDTGKLLDISIELDIQHTWIGDLIIQLVPPNGEMIVLQDREGGSGKSAKTPMNSVLDSMLRPLRGQNCQGEWVLEISDRAEADEGVLKSWTLELAILE